MSCRDVVSKNVTELRPQPAQELFLSSPADIVIYGGAAGGGKSWALVVEPLRHVHIKGFGAVIFRRVSTELSGPGSLWEFASELYPTLGAELRENPSREARFPSGATIHFSHLQYVQDIYAHHGKQYALVIFDELQRFEEIQFWYLLSRMRSTCGVRPYMRASCNPDPEGFVRTLIAWWIGDPECERCAVGKCLDLEHGQPIPERMGVLRHFVRIGGELHWADTREELLEQFDDVEPLSLTFIGARLDDNPALLAADPGYRAKLKALPPVEQARLLGGDWNVRPQGGKYVSADCFTARWIKDGTPGDNIVLLPDNLYIYMASDFAVSEPTDDSDPDYTEHGVFGIGSDRTVYILDWWYGQTTSDVWIAKLIDMWKEWDPLAWLGEGGVIRRAIEPSLKREMDERNVYCRVEWLNPLGRSPGQSSSKEGYADRSKQAKAIRGRPFQAMAHNRKFIFPLSAPWLAHVLGLIVNFPAKGKDDPFDVVSLFASALDMGHPAVTIDGDDDERPRDYSSRRGSRSWRTP